MAKYNMVAQNVESTVVSEYKSEKAKDTAYQSEAELETAFINQLTKQAYEYLPIHSEKDLIENLRKQLEKLNSYQFTDSEWQDFFTKVLSNSAYGITEKTHLIQEDYKQILTRPDNSFQTIKLIDKENIHNNTLQVINQYATDSGKHSNRYDVTVLVNGLPLVHIELKRRGVDIKEAFNQINRYQNESFWSDCGLFEFVQVFVISNGTYTKYYSNTTRNAHIKEFNAGVNSKNSKKTSNSFEFTSWWADSNNKPIIDLMDFAKTFFQKHTILNILTKYCIFNTDKILLVMRPYQIVATERIINQIQIATNYKTYGSVEAGGYIFHTTGSGKTLTSFKTALLASKMPKISKVLFVVDRKDLDYQTMKEYDRFQKGAADSNTNTAVLTKQLGDSNSKIIITTIQKLTCFIKQNKKHKVFDENIVIIFDECHRSQFGEMHELITKHFKKYYMFGFTGTPIYTKNASAGGKITLKTTEQAFGKCLHQYTIVDAISDKNVLPFRVDYVSTMKEEENIKDEKVWNIDREKALASPKRISKIVEYILEHFNQKTMRNEKSYDFSRIENVAQVVNAKDRNTVQELKNSTRLTGFNSIFAVASIDTAKAYYNEFKKQMAELTPDKRLKIATIYSFGVNDDSNSETGNLAEENPEDTSGLDTSSREFLDNAIKDYNAMFKTNYSTDSQSFQNYYKDLSLRMKNREIDLLIVVNMFLTGFDATTLNTLWVDKNLRMHGLLQAYSRTNRILNSIKTFGNIVCFRNLEQATNESIALFGDKNAGGVVLLKKFEEYYNGYTDSKGKEVLGYKTLIEQLQDNYKIGEIITSESAQKAFVKLYGSILRVRNILSVFDEFKGQEILTEREFQDYQSEYLRIYDEIRNKAKQDNTNINDDIVFEIELVKQVEVNIDYILMLIKKYHSGHMKDKEIVSNISKSIDSSMELRNKKELIMQFIDSLTPTSDIDKDWLTYVNAAKKSELNKIIQEENLNKTEAYAFVNAAFHDGYVTNTGIAITKVIPPVPMFTKDNKRSELIQRVLDKITAFFEKFRAISSTEMAE